jgi:hypothetical protein
VIHAGRPTSAIVACVNVVAVVADQGSYAWLLRDVQRVEPAVPCRGRQGIWYPDAAAMVLVWQRLR